MMKAAVFFALFSSVEAFVMPGRIAGHKQALSMAAEPKSSDAAISRRDATAGVFGALLGAQALGIMSPEPAFARGRSTQIASWGRYGSRVEAIRGFLAGDLRALIAADDYEGIKAATGKKGVVNSYLGALDLWAATYSDSSPSPKSVAMQMDVIKIREAAAELNLLAKKATGEEVKKEGGLFGIGAKEEAVPKGDAMKKLLNESRDKAVAAYNDYCVLNNEGHPFEVDELSEI